MLKGPQPKPGQKFDLADPNLAESDLAMLPKVDPAELAREGVQTLSVDYNQAQVGDE